MKLKIKQLPIAEGLPLPMYATKGAAAMDIVAAEDSVIPVKGAARIRTGICVEIPEGYEIQFRPRSGLAYNHGITVLNSPGTIDSDYRGELMGIMVNHGFSNYHVTRGERIAQLVLAKVEQAEIEQVLELGDTERGSGGFGSTGK